MTPAPVVRVGLLALATVIACGKSERSKSSPDPGPVSAGSGGVPEQAGAGGSADSGAGAPRQAGAGGESDAGAAGAGGVATDAELELVASDITITREVQADSEYFYIVIHPVHPTNEPGDIVRLPIGGGSPELLVQDVSGSQADLQLYDGALYYKSDAEIRTYDLTTQQDSTIVSLSEINGAQSFNSFKAGPGGVYWITEYNRQLQRRSAPSAAVETLETPEQVYHVLKVEAEQVVITEATLPFVVSIYDLSTPQPLNMLTSYIPEAFVPAAIDDEAYYYLQVGSDTLLRRVQRSDAIPRDQGIFVAEDQITTLTQWEALSENPVVLRQTTELLLFEQTLIVRMDDKTWYAVSKADGSSKALPELAPCLFLFIGEDELFCSTGEAFGTDVYRVSPTLLAQ